MKSKPLGAFARALLARHFANDLLPVRPTCPSTHLLYLCWRAAVQPVRSGHGACRPWRLGSVRAPARDEPSVDLPDTSHPTETDPAPSLWLDRLARMADWPAYLTALLGRRDATRPTSARPG